MRHENLKGYDPYTRNVVRKIYGSAWSEDVPWTGGQWGQGRFLPEKFNPNKKYEPKGRLIHLASNPERFQEDPFDLENLRFFKPKDAKALLQSLERLNRSAERKGEETKIVAIIGEGGTPAMKLVEGKLRPMVDTDTILGELPGSKRRIFKAASIEFPTMMDSSLDQLDYTADFVILMSSIWNQMSDSLKEKFAGFVVIHGTDTMSETGSDQPMMFGPNCPFSVGIAGAQKTTFDDYNEVSANINGTFTTLKVLHDNKTPMQFAYMNGTSGAAFNPTGLIKINDGNVEGFATPMHPPIIDAADFGRSGIHPTYLENWQRAQENQNGFRPIPIRGYVPVREIISKKGADPKRDYYDILNNLDDRAVVMTTFGTGTAHPHNLIAIAEAAKERGIPFFVANPFPTGSLEHFYAEAEEVRRSGGIPVRMMPNALRTKIALGYQVYGNNTEALVRFVVGTNFANEQPPGWEQPNNLRDKIAPYGIPDDFLIAA